MSNSGFTREQNRRAILWNLNPLRESMTMMLTPGLWSRIRPRMETVEIFVRRMQFHELNAVLLIGIGVIQFIIICLNIQMLTIQPVVLGDIMGIMLSTIDILLVICWFRIAEMPTVRFFIPPRPIPPTWVSYSFLLAATHRKSVSILSMIHLSSMTNICFSLVQFIVTIIVMSNTKNVERFGFAVVMFRLTWAIAQPLFAWYDAYMRRATLLHNIQQCWNDHLTQLLPPLQRPSHPRQMITNTTECPICLDLIYKHVEEEVSLPNGISQSQSQSQSQTAVWFSPCCGHPFHLHCWEQCCVPHIADHRRPICPLCRRDPSSFQSTTEMLNTTNSGQDDHQTTTSSPTTSSPSAPPPPPLSPQPPAVQRVTVWEEAHHTAYSWTMVTVDFAVTIA